MSINDRGGETKISLGGESHVRLASRESRLLAGPFSFALYLGLSGK